MSTLRIVQEELKPWQQHNFPGREAWEPLVGMQEELGELSHAFLKRHQKIRLTENHDEQILDSLADLLVYACDFANAVGVDLDRALAETWARVRERDWRTGKEAEL